MTPRSSRRLIAAVAAAAAVAALASCRDAAPDPPIDAIVLSPAANLEIPFDSSAKVTARLYGADGRELTGSHVIRWNMAFPAGTEGATFASGGDTVSGRTVTLKGTARGTRLLQAAAEGRAAIAYVTVTSPVFTVVWGVASPVTVRVGQTTDFSYAPLDADLKTLVRPVRFSVSDSTVLQLARLATAPPNVVSFKGLRIGTTQATVTCDGLSATVTVQVQP